MTKRPEEIALLLIERRQALVPRGIAHVIGERALAGGIDREDVELMHLAKLGHQRPRRQGVADLPAGDVVGLAE